MTAIDRMTRFGRKFSIKLDCGHTIARTIEEAKLQQLYIGKRIGCPWCAAIEAGDSKAPSDSWMRAATMTPLVKREKGKR